jgi:hypothetical protein
MPDYIYQVRAYVDISMLPRGTGGTLIQQDQANLAGYGPNQGAGTGPASQTLRLAQAEVVPNALATAPTVANLTSAMTTLASDLTGQITPATLAMIQNWATGQE